MINLRLLTCLGLLTCALASMAQDDADDPRARFEAFRQQAAQRYDDFRQEANRKYGEFREEAWKKYQSCAPIPKPKDEEIPPVIIPKDEQDEEEQEPTPITIEDIVTVTLPIPEPQPKPLSPIKEIPTPTTNRKEFPFYGTICSVRMPQSIAINISDCSNSSLTTAWNTLSDGTYDNAIFDLLSLRKNMQLSDWAYLNLVSTFAEAVLGKGNEATFFTAFIYCQSGYKMRIGRAGSKLCMLFASKYEIYEQSYFVIDGVNYYPFNSAMTSMEIYDMPYPKETALSLLISNEQLFTYKTTEARTLTSERYPEMSVTLSVNKNAIDFFDSYPSSSVNNDFMTRWAMYANTPLDERVKAELYPVVKQCIEGKNEKDAANRILNWVQTAFVYEYDNKVWGHDRAFFAEETLYYPYCDCEDRSILFSHIMRDCMGVDVLLVYYPGHLATAVAFGSEVGGDYITYEGRRYTICDPTYIGASIGRTMPGMDNSKVRVVKLELSHAQ